MDELRSPSRGWRINFLALGLAVFTAALAVAGQPGSEAAQAPVESPAAPWTNLTTTGGDDAVSLAVNRQPVPAMFAGTFANGVYASLNGGATWSNPLAESTLALATGVITPTTAYAGSFYGSFWRAPDGVTWTEHSDGLTASTVAAILPTSAMTIYLGADGAVYLSPDGGDTWAPVGTGLPQTALVTALELDGGVIVAGTDNSGVFRSIDLGQSWDDASAGLGSGSVYDLQRAGQVLHAATGDGVYASLDQAANWTLTNNGLSNTDVRALAASRRAPRVLVAGTTSGVFVSGNHGANWGAAVTALPGGNDSVNALATTGQPVESVIAATNGGVWKLANIADLGCRAVPDAAFAAPATTVDAADIGASAGAWQGAYSPQKDLDENGSNDIVDIMLTTSVFGTTCTP